MTMDVKLTTWINIDLDFRSEPEVLTPQQIETLEMEIEYAAEAGEVHTGIAEHNGLEVTYYQFTDENSLYICTKQVVH